MNNQKINLIDFQILSLLAQREKLIQGMLADKQELTQIPKEIVDLLIAPQADFVKQAKVYGLPSDFSRKLYRLILHKSLKVINKASNNIQTKNVFAIRKSTKRTF